MRRAFSDRFGIECPFGLSVMIALAALLLFTRSADAQCDPITTERVGAGFALPVYVASPPGDTSRLFVVERGGAIAVLQLATGTTLGTFLDIVPLVNSTSQEQGLLGLAFDPDYQTNGYFYVNYTDAGWDTVIARYTAAGNPVTSHSADPNSAVVLKTINQPFANHNGGCLQFGPDGMLYIGMGDGGSHGDPGNRAQDGGSLLGKILRLDVDNPPTYVPNDNPFVGPGNPRDEIWQTGLRHPWRFSFDRQTGDMYIGDVGESEREEINYIPAGTGAARNFGWRCYEGTVGYNTSGCGPFGSYDPPIYDYSHASGVAVTGGYVYRGDALPSWQGVYFFADYASARVWSFRVVNSNMVGFAERTAALDPPGSLNIATISSFGQGADGEIYIVDYGGGEIFKIIPRAPAVDCNGNGFEDSCDIAEGRSPDSNGNGVPDECDQPCPADLAGADGTVNVFDLFELLSNWNDDGPGANLAAPLNVVDVFDLFVLLGAWGDC